MNNLKKLPLVSAFLIMGAVSASADWVAGRDLKANELPDGNGIELIDPNPTVPQWSYGFRGTLTGTALTLFTTAQHTNSGGGNSSMQGFIVNNDAPAVTVNTGSSDVIFNFGFGPLNPIHPGEMSISPGPVASNAFTIVRWTVPASGSYLIDAYWTDLDPHGSQFGGVNGATGAITINGSTIFNQDFVNGGGTSTTLTLSLTGGDLVDFITGSQGDYRFDTTGFDVTITAVPEPTTTASLISGATLLGSSFYLRRRRWRH